MGFVRWRLGGLALLSGVLQVLPFPIAGPTPLWRTAFCWVALVPLLVALLAPGPEDARWDLLRGAVLGYLSGVTWYAGSCYWIFQTMHLYGGLSQPVAAGILVLFCLYLGLYPALFGALIAAFRRSPMGRQGALLLAPAAWVAVELARARITGFPWDLLGVAQVDNAVLTRLAPYTGAYGLSFVIAAVNSLWLLRLQLRARRFTRLAVTAAGFVMVVLYGAAVWRTEHGGASVAAATATLVQENLEVGAVADAGPQESMSQQVQAFSALSLAPSASFLAGTPELGTAPRVTVLRHSPRPPDVILWPESPAPFQEQDSTFRADLSRLAKAAHAPLIIGDLAFERSTDPSNRRGYAPRNRASFVTPEGSVQGHYDKMHLVPFGEYTPYKRLFFFAGSLLEEVGLFEPGEVRSVFTTEGNTFGTFICYESIFGDEIRRFVLRGADVLVNLSNDGWYGDTSAPWQHLNMVRMRAIENHRWVLRATNTGVTASIDPFGRVIASAPRHVRTAILVPFGYEHELTFYTRHGDLFAYACALATVLALAWSLLSDRATHALESEHVN